MKIPYNNHRNIPMVNTEYMLKDRSFVCFVLIVFKAWGKKDMVVQAAASNPSMVTKFIKVQEM